MKILYAANIRLPTEKAHGVQIMKTCEALVRAGATVELVVPTRHNAILQDAFEYYEVSPIFTITVLRVPDLIRFGKAGFWFQSLLFSRRAARFAKIKNPECVYTRDEGVAAAALRRGLPVVWESHTGSWNKAARYAAEHARLVIAISQGLKDFYVLHGVPADKVLVAHDGIDLADFARAQSKEESRARLSLPLEAKIALYAGRLDGWKGSDTLLEASKLLEGRALVALIGGEPSQIEGQHARHPQAMFLGYRPYRELPGNLAAADVVVLPNTGRDEVSAKFTSPLKLFAYMAAGKPIVAADLPSIREILDDSAAYFFKPDDAQSLAEAICLSLSDAEAPVRAAKARVLADEYAWDTRAKKILLYLSRQ